MTGEKLTTDVFFFITISIYIYLPMQEHRNTLIHLTLILRLNLLVCIPQ